MKTIKLTATALVAIFLVSCGSYYRMVTTLERDGGVLREVYTGGDSAFLAGNMSHNPYLFDITTDWTIGRLDSVVSYDFFGNKKNLNVKVTKTSPSIDLFSKELSYVENKSSLVAPQEMLTKKFRWFYTHYSFKATYKKLDYDFPVPIDKLLTREEQKLWTQGNLGGYWYMNGYEMNEALGEIEDKFIDWYSRNCFEISLACIEKVLGEITPESDKEKVYKLIVERELNDDMSPKIVCRALDSYYKTNRFSRLYKNSENNLDAEFEKATSIIDIIGNTISYELVVPNGALFTQSPSVIYSNTLTWKIDGMRILFDDYTISAEYRLTNDWAFIVSGLVLVIAVTGIVLLIRKRAKRDNFS